MKLASVVLIRANWFQPPDKDRAMSELLSARESIDAQCIRATKRKSRQVARWLSEVKRLRASQTTIGEVQTSKEVGTPMKLAAKHIDPAAKAK